MPSRCTTGNKNFKAGKGKRLSKPVVWMHLPASRSSGTTGSLIGVGLADRGDLESIHTHLRVVYLEFTVPSIHDVTNTIDYRHISSIERTITKKTMICTC